MSSTDTAFVLMYHPALGNAQVLAPLIGVPTYAAHGWLLVDPAATPPPVAAPYLTQGAADSRYLRDWAGAETVTAGAVRLAPDGHTIVRNANGTTRASYDATEQAAWTVVGGGGGSGGAVASVNGKTGAVVLSASDVGAQPAGDYATNTALTTGLSGKASKLVAAVPTVVAHRGYGGLWNGYSEGPMGGLEESVLASRAYLAKASTLFPGTTPAINLHVRALSDGTLVCIHDATVNRTTNGTGNVTDYDLSAWSLLSLTPAAQAGYGIAPVTTQTPPTLLEALNQFGNKAHLMIEASAPVAAQIAALVNQLGLAPSVSINSFSATQCAAAAAAGIASVYNPPDLGSANSDAATIAALNIWPAGAPKHVSLNYQPQRSVTGGATTSGSTAITAASGLAGLDGWNIRGTGIPFGATISVQSDTAATLSAAATATGTGVTFTLWPTVAQMATYIQSLVAAGLEVSAYIVNLRSDKAWLTTAGVKHFISDEPIYLQASAQIRAGTAADPTSKGAWPDGVLLADPALPNQSAWGRGSISNGGHSLDKNLGGNSEMHLIRGDVSFLGTVPATYTVRADCAFQSLPTDTTRWVALRFGCVQDANFSDNLTFGAGMQDGYMVLVRANGQVGLYRHHVGVGAVQLGTTQTMSSLPTAGGYFRFVVAVTATGITVSIKDTAETTTYATITATDSTYRGGYIGVGKNEASSGTYVATFKNLQAA